jgi:tyrosine-protein phosphatase YwqE
MNIINIKKKMLEWEDFYGQDIVETDLIRKATTKTELREILQSHIEFLEMQNNDATRNAEDFMSELGLTFID